jgi:hypothetical protein
MCPPRVAGRTRIAWISATPSKSGIPMSLTSTSAAKPSRAFSGPGRDER